MTKLFVGGIPYSITNKQIEELFAQFGKVRSVSIVTDKYSGQSKGFAFVEMEDDSQAQEAIKQLDGYGLEGRKIGVSVARPREDNFNRSNFSHNNFSRRDDKRPFRNNYRR